MSSQLDRWTGEFGDAYTDRNPVDWQTRAQSLDRLIPTDVGSVLEVGCNRGHNLVALESLDRDLRVFGAEPNDRARKIARKQGLLVHNRSVYNLPKEWQGRQFDLAMTSGVLIHIPPARLDEALTGLYAASGKYLLAIEYDGADEMISYRGLDDMLWKRNIGAHYTRLFPDLELVDVGVAPAGFEEATFWLLQK